MVSESMKVLLEKYTLPLVLCQALRTQMFVTEDSPKAQQLAANCRNGVSSDF